MFQFVISFWNFIISADDLDLESFGKKKKKKKQALSMKELEDSLPTDKAEVRAFFPIDLK